MWLTSKSDGMIFFPSKTYKVHQNHVERGFLAVFLSKMLLLLSERSGASVLSAGQVQVCWFRKCRVCCVFHDKNMHQISSLSKQQSRSHAALRWEKTSSLAHTQPSTHTHILPLTKIAQILCYDYWWLRTSSLDLQVIKLINNLRLWPLPGHKRLKWTKIPEWTAGVFVVMFLCLISLRV